ncbi:MAG: ATP-binding cassette domain-containing protein, partial [Oscillospiraceae bacterium]|nr:ATP-binding cassette domain-containing protein [Oscillospiraceae bacterium]
MKKTKPIISVTDLRKSYKDKEVLKGVNFTVRPGQIFALLGSNGAGKTTTVRMLATLLKANGGQASVCGYDVQREPDQVRRSISLTGQYAAVDEVLTGRENLRLMGALLHLKDGKQKAEELLEAFRLTDAANSRVSTYSGGMRRRLDIAMSLMGKPPVIFLDEPTTGLDPQNRIAMWEIVKEMAAGGTTIFL